jgi:ubiquinone/menaquinone biosynthesis C-methylase UbiE
MNTVKTTHDVPSYEPMLAAYHRAFAPELRALVATLPLAEGNTVLDMACGDGAYSPWLAERVGPSGRIAAVDIRPEYLALARKEAARSPNGRIIEVSAGSIDALPFTNDTFDLCWCAESLYSLLDPIAALRSLLRVTKPGAVIAVLEADTLHHVILPWPVDVELAVRAAELEALKEGRDDAFKFYVGRRLRTVCRTAGLERIQTRSIALDRAAPLGANERRFLEEYLRRLSMRVAPYLRGPLRDEFDGLVDPASSDCMLNDGDLTSTCINELAWGYRPLRGQTGGGG